MYCDMLGTCHFYMPVHVFIFFLKFTFSYEIHKLQSVNISKASKLFSIQHSNYVKQTLVYYIWKSFPNQESSVLEYTCMALAIFCFSNDSSMDDRRTCICKPSLLQHISKQVMQMPSLWVSVLHQLNLPDDRRLCNACETTIANLMLEKLHVR